MIQIPEKEGFLEFRAESTGGVNKVAEELQKALRQRNVNAGFVP